MASCATNAKSASSQGERRPLANRFIRARLFDQRQPVGRQPDFVPKIIESADVLVVGPNGFSAVPTLQKVRVKKGGTVRCGTFVIGTVNGTYCGFSDKSVGGILVSYDLAKPADAAALTDRVRQQIEK